MISQQIHSISDLRFKTKDLLQKAHEAPVFLFHRSTPKGVLLSLEAYQEMTDRLEDYYLSLKAEEYEKERKKNVRWIFHKTIKALLK